MSGQHKRLNKRLWARARWAALERDNWRCRGCGKAGVLQVDHVKPLQDGGEKYDLRNLRSLCVECHRIKSYERPNPEREEWRVFMRK